MWLNDLDCYNYWHPFWIMTHMKKIHNLIYTTLLLIFAVTVQAQDFTKVDATVKSWPDFADTDKFAAKVNADFKREDEKARAIFTWIATHIKYDLAAYGVNERPVAYSFKTQEEKQAKEKKFKEDLAQKTLKTKKGVCQGYATLFLIVAEKAGLEPVIITGTSKSHPAHIGAAPGASDHAWNAVKIGGEWKLLDATWAAGTVTIFPMIKNGFSQQRLKRILPNCLCTTATT